MQKNTLISLVFTIVAGCFGILFRWLHLIAAFEEDTGLPIRGAWQTLAIIALVAVTAAVLFLLTRRFSRCVPLPGAAGLFSGSVVAPVASWLACALAVFGAVGMFSSASASAYPLLIRILAILALATGLSFPAFAADLRKKRSGSLTCFFSLVPVIFSCFWLIVSYKDHAADPVVSSFAFEILAIAASILGFFYVAGFPCGSPKPMLSFFFCNLGAFLCLVTLADGHTLSETLIFASMAVMQLAFAACVGMNLKPRDSE